MIHGGKYKIKSESVRIQIYRVKFFTKIVLTEKNKKKIGVEHKVKSLRI